MGRQESPQLIERKTQLDTDAYADVNPFDQKKHAFNTRAKSF